MIVTSTVDVSGTGIRIDAPGQLEDQDPTLVDLFLPGSNFWITIAATVKWRTPSEAGIELSHDPWSREWMGRLLERLPDYSRSARSRAPARFLSTNARCSQLGGARSSARS